MSRNLIEYPITEQEVTLCLLDMQVMLLEHAEIEVGDVRGYILARMVKHIDKIFDASHYAVDQ